MMKNNMRALATPAFVGMLPSSARTKGGATFNPRADKWVYRDGVRDVSIDFSFSPLLSNNFRHSLKVVLMWYAENMSPAHLQNMHSHFVRLVRDLASMGIAQIDEITSIDILNYKASRSKGTEWYVGALSGLLKKWHGLGLPGVTDDAVALLKELRVKGNAKGTAVLTMDPLNGPFTNIELEAIQSEIESAYAEKIIDEGIYHLAWLFMSLGPRPAQFAALKVCDITGTPTAEGDVTYILNLPRAKQGNKHLRVAFKKRPLVSQIGKPLLEYSQRVRASYAELLDDPRQAPLFPQEGFHEGSPGFEYHETAKGLSRALVVELNKLKIFSERTGDQLHITPVRFRRTFGTRAAQEGHGELVIAEMLDHTDTQNVGVYVAAVPEIAARINRTVAMQMAPLAQAFKGILINDESEATRAGDPSSRIIDLRIDSSTKPVGSCGQHSFCNFSAPIACYTCRSFEPWLDGPHEAVLKHLIEKRDQLLQATDQRMASINDRTIVAVAQVVQMCQEQKGKGAR